MIKNRSSHLLFILILPAAMMTALSGCGHDGNKQSTDSRQQNADVNLHRQDSTNQYKFDIQLPEIIRTHKALRDTLTALADQSQQSFISRARKDTMPPERPPWELQLHLSLQHSTRHFISVLGEGYEYMGGAHGMPFYITLTYNSKKKEFVELRDILADSTALRPISEYVQKQLLRQFEDSNISMNNNWLKEGTAPSYSNYNNVLLRPQGITIIFDAYQVGPYVIGTPEVEVPASVFRKEFPPYYQQWFNTTN